MNFKESNYHFNSSRISTHQGARSTLQGLQRTTSSQLFKDFKGLHHSSLQSRTSTLQGHRLYYKDYITLRCNQGHRLIKDIDSSRTSTLLQGLHHFTAITLILLWPQYRSMMTFYDTKRALQTNSYRSGLSENEKRNIRDKASR